MLNLWTAAFLAFLVLMGSLAFLIYLAMQGSIIATFILALICVLTIFAFFKTGDIIYDTLRDRAEGRRMQQNIYENTQLLNQQFKAQNQALTGEARQLRLASLAQLPAPEQELSIDDGLSFEKMADQLFDPERVEMDYADDAMDE